MSVIQPIVEFMMQYNQPIIMNNTTSPRFWSRESLKTHQRFVNLVKSYIGNNLTDTELKKKLSLNGTIYVINQLEMNGEDATLYRRNLTKLRENTGKGHQLHYTKLLTISLTLLAMTKRGATVPCKIE